MTAGCDLALEGGRGYADTRLYIQSMYIYTESLHNLNRQLSPCHNQLLVTLRWEKSQGFGRALQQLALPFVSDLFLELVESSPSASVIGRLGSTGLLAILFIPLLHVNLTFPRPTLWDTRWDEFAGFLGC